MKKFNFSRHKKKDVLKTSLIHTYKDFVSYVGLSNRLILSNFNTYKFYIIKGNNDELIRRVLKRRKWLETHNI